MPFQKGNKLWKEGLKVRQEKGHKIDEFLLIVANGGIEQYADILDKLARDVELSKQEIEYMDRIERWVEYIKPKLARKELTGKDGEKLFPKPILDVHEDDSNEEDNGDDQEA